MTWVLLVTAAIGGGIVTWLLDQWVTSIRTFETARLLLVAELTMISSALALRADLGGDFALPTSTWDSQRHILARPIVCRDRQLWTGLAAVYGSIELAARLGEVGRAEVDRLLSDLKGIALGRVQTLVAYGPTALCHRNLASEV
jgi:hypothetical protein